MAIAQAPDVSTPATASRVHPNLEREERLRYSRHLILPEVGVEGQRRLKGARVLLVGAGGLGSPAAMYLAAAGVGTLGIVDFDAVDLTNLQRQVVHGTADVGRSKVASAADRVADINPHVSVERFETQLSSANALEIVGAFDVVLDGSDNFPTRYLVNDACVLTGRPNIYASVLRFEGQASVFAAEDGPCYRCLFREPPPDGLLPNCAEAGVLGVLPGLMGTIQATEAIKLILGIGDPLIGRLLLVDALRLDFRTIRLQRDPQCPLCGTHEITELIDYERFCGVSPDPQGSQVNPIPEITAHELLERRARGDDFDVIDVREPREFAMNRIPGARLIPLGTLGDALGSLDQDREMVLVCHIGARSAQAVRILQHAGFTRVANLAGGMVAWEALPSG